MSARVLSFYFDYISPYAYLAWHRLRALAPEHDLRIELKPVLFAGLLNEYGHKGPAEIEPKRNYMFKDCTRLAAAADIPFAPPASHPFNPLPPLRASLLDMPDDIRAELVTRLFAATWAEGAEIGSPEFVANVCADVGVPDALRRIAEPMAKTRLREATADAIQHGVFGVPALIVDRELFWGNDSFPHLECYLVGRDPVLPGDAERWALVKPSAQR